MDYSEMDVTCENDVTILSGNNQWQSTNEHLQLDNSINNFYSHSSFVYNQNAANTEPLPPKKDAIDQNNHVKRIPSFFRKAKLFCDNMLNKCKSSGHIEQSIDEITMQMAQLRFTSPTGF